MASVADHARLSGNRLKIVETATRLAIAYRASIYSQTGKSTALMDCSYFVYLVLHDVFVDYEYLNTTGILASSQFQVTAALQPGDLVFFPASQVASEVKNGNERVFPNHVGIVVGGQSWIGRQTSSLGEVLFANPWWNGRPRKFLRHVKADAGGA